ncbi:MAG: hypothetical protein ABSG67_20345 [Thermoguttaceae bacterium]|jgi:hypothetical protein
MGEWLPKQGPEPQRPTDLPAPVVLTETDRLCDPIPANWTSLPPGDILENHEVFNRHFIYYRVAPPPGQPFAVSRIGDIKGEYQNPIAAAAAANDTSGPP